MRILWLVNVPLPEACLVFGCQNPMSGGWMFRTAEDISDVPNLDLYIAFPWSGTKKIISFSGEKIKYYAFPPIKNSPVVTLRKNRTFGSLLTELNPDLVHIWGTELAHTLVMINECKRRDIKNVISIQGIVSNIAQSYLCGIPHDVINQRTFRDFIKKDNLRDQQKKFELRGGAEIEAILQSKLIIGRTTWDQACVQTINPNIKYIKCDETMRSIFYDKEWSIERCEQFSIFVSQGAYPIKGLHFILMAMPLILKKYPEAKLYVSGRDLVSIKGLNDRLKQTSYSRYLTGLIKKNGLERNVTFVGVLNEEDMCKRYLISHVFACPSSIENSPNSLGEAMLLGVPCVASYVGGIPDMLKNNYEGFLYQHDSPHMLAYYICELFSNPKLAKLFSERSRKRAMKTHNRSDNMARLLEIYNSIDSRETENR